MFNLISKKEIIGIAVILLLVHGYYINEAAQINRRGVQLAGGLIFLNYFKSLFKVTLVYYVIKKICIAFKNKMMGSV